jgi:hypothetical protein
VTLTAAVRPAVPSPWPRSHALKVLCALWASPTIVIGLVVTLAIIVLNGFKVRLHLRHGALDVICMGWLARKMAAAHWGAFTIGLVGHYWGEKYEDAAAYTNTFWHERLGHMRQQLIYGILQWLLYAIYMGLGYAQTRSWKAAYKMNPFERDANAREGIKT